jgi:chemotaxis signal transduction protein
MSEPTAQNRKFLIFSLHGTHYALDVAQIAEVGDPPQLLPIPLVPPCYGGALILHGDVVAVLDLARFLGLAGCGTPGKIIALQRNMASLAFLVDTVIRIIPEDEVSFRNNPESCFSKAILDIPGGEAIQLDVEALLHALENDMRKKR